MRGVRMSRVQVVRRRPAHPYGDATCEAIVDTCKVALGGARTTSEDMQWWLNGNAPGVEVAGGNLN
jgi:hypothetical protein